MRTWPPRATAGQPRACAGVGSANVPSNHARVSEPKTSRASTTSAYRGPTERTHVRIICCDAATTEKIAGLLYLAGEEHAQRLHVRAERLLGVRRRVLLREGE